MSTETLTIEKLGLSGDGVARGPFGPVYVSFTLPTGSRGNNSGPD